MNTLIYTSTTPHTFIAYTGATSWQAPIQEYANVLSVHASCFMGRNSLKRPSCELLMLVLIELFSLRSKNLKIKIYRTIILAFVLYGCETWSLILREERRLRVFKNRVLTTVFGAKREMK
jgi:hypothetical protein